MKPGTVTLKGTTFWIVVPPFNAQKLVPLFIGCKRAEDKTNAIIVANTDDNCDLIEWVRLRFPLEADATTTERLTGGKARFDARNAAIAATRDHDYEPPIFDLALPPRLYQRQAADMAIRSNGLLLADDVGLGKTVSAIATMTAAGACPVIVVTLTHLTRQWEAEIKRFAPALRVHVVTKATPYPLADEVLTELNVETGRRRIVKNGVARLPDVVVLNYHKLDKWRDALLALAPGLVVWDECQELRTGEKSNKGSAAFALAEHARFRLGLSATPIYNYGREIWNVIQAISPGILGSEAAFLAEWCDGSGDKAKLKNPEVLRSFLVERGAMLRRRRKEVGRELPPMQRIWMTVDTDAKKLKEISAQVAEFARKVLTAEKISPYDRREAAKELSWRLRQATGLAKAASVVDLVRLLLDADPSRRVLLYGHHHLVFDAWAEGFAKSKHPAVEFTGRQTPNQKAAALAAFKSGAARVLMMAIRSGAGIDGLQFVANTVVNGELDWSPGVHIQAEGRLDRDGQPESVLSIFAVADDGSDPTLREVLGLKESQRAGLVDGDTSGSSELDGADIDRIKRLATAYLEQHGHGR